MSQRPKSSELRALPASGSQMSANNSVAFVERFVGFDLLSEVVVVGMDAKVPLDYRSRLVGRRYSFP